MIPVLFLTLPILSFAIISLVLFESLLLLTSPRRLMISDLTHPPVPAAVGKEHNEH